MVRFQRHHFVSVCLFVITIVVTAHLSFLNSTTTLNRPMENEEEIQVTEQEFKMADNTSGATPATKEEAALPNMQQKNQQIAFPDIYAFLPHLLNDSSSTFPAYSDGHGRPRVPLVLGIPTVKRESQSYLVPTINSLLENMDETEKNRTLIIIFIAETDHNYAAAIADKIKKTFKTDFDRGLIEIISPPASFYPNFATLRQTLNDPMDRVKWRTKQNLDYAFLMMYCRSRGDYYVQLEDDIITTPGFVSTMIKFAAEKDSTNSDWFLLDFSQLGFIGKMFKIQDLAYLVEFLVMFHNDRPVDWLITPILETRYCPHAGKDCEKTLESKWIHHNPSLFQHMGIESSLRGKVQKLKDKQFYKASVFIAHKNPEAEVTSTIKGFRKGTVAKAYLGHSAFWGIAPKSGDTILFNFPKPVSLTSYKIKSGSPEAPADLMRNTTVEVRPANWNTTLEQVPFPVTKDHYVVIGEFNELGSSEGTWNLTRFGLIDSFRLAVHSDNKNWVFIKEIFLETTAPSLS